VLSKRQYYDFVRLEGTIFGIHCRRDPYRYSLAAFETGTLRHRRGRQSKRAHASERDGAPFVCVDVEAERFEQLFLNTLNTPENKVGSFFLKNAARTVSGRPTRVGAPQEWDRKNNMSLQVTPQRSAHNYMEKLSCEAVHFREAI